VLDWLGPSKSLLVMSADGLELLNAERFLDVGREPTRWKQAKVLGKEARGGIERAQQPVGDG
jgi:hypothetical protein